MGPPGSCHSSADDQNTDRPAMEARIFGEATGKRRPSHPSGGRVLRHNFLWRTAMRRAGLRRDAVYLVRPDGHVGLADAAGDAAAIERYLEEHSIRLA